MKKLICLILTLSLILTTIAFGAETDNYQTVLATVKQRLDIKDIYDNFDSRTSNYNGQTTYYFTWSTNDGVYLSVAATDSLVITEYSLNDSTKPYEQKQSFKKYELDQYKAKAEEYIKILNPDLAQNIVVSDNDRYSIWTERTSFSLKFEYNGVPVENVSGNISVNSEDMSLIHFNFSNYAPVTYPDKSNFISKDEAIKAYGENYGLELVYLLEYKDDLVTAVPVYQPVSQYNEYINAVTGEKYKYDPSVIYAEMEASKDAMGSLNNSFSEIELKEISNIEGLLSIKEVENNLKAISVLGISKSAVVSSYYLNKLKGNKYTYDVTFTDNEDNTSYANLNAKTGELLNYRKYNKNNSETELPLETLKSKAVDYAKILSGDKYNKYKDSVIFEGKNLTLNRKENGARVEGDTIRINVNKADGTLEYYNINYTDATFPSLDNVISNNMALKVLFAEVNYDVKYLFVPLKNKLPENAVAVYSFDYSQNLQIDPFTGELKKYENTLDKIEYSDISGHYAEKQILKLAQYNIGFNDKNFCPDNAITQKEAITLLMQAFQSVSIYRNYNYDNMFDEAVRMGLITKEQRDDNATVTRLDGAVMIAKSIGADEYARLEGIWNCKFKDVTEKVGYVCLLNGMGIINGDENNNFNPNNNLTKADCAILIYNCLAN